MVELAFAVGAGLAGGQIVVNADVYRLRNGSGVMALSS